MQQQRSSAFLHWRIGIAILVVCITLLPVLAFVRFATAHAATFSLSWKELVPVLSKSLIFTMAQALASTALALVIGMPGAWLAAKYRFPFRSALLALAAVPFCMPPMLVV
ncbi:MAG: hypothetical protein QHH01_05250, partial [Spirochaetales bacterium]|nr:hypothetical protein [Spirochaetales bacterium]